MRTVTRPTPRTPLLLAALVAMLATLLAVPQPATAEDTGTIAGTIFHDQDLNGGRAPNGFAEFYTYDAETDEYTFLSDVAAASDGTYTAELPVGTYAVVLYNSSQGGFFTDFFPELYKEKPLLDDDPTQVQVTAGATTTVNGNLDVLFLDMFDTPFTDDIGFLRNAGVTRGCNPDEGNTRFCPKQIVTRGQMAAFLVRFFDLTAIDESIEFTDVEDSIFRDDILRLATAGITRGCNPPDNDEFCPTDQVTRGQMAAFVVRAFGMSETSDVSFSDTDDSPFVTDINKLATANVTRGCNPPDNDRYCPTDPVTREQMAAFLNRAFQWLGDQEAAAFDGAVAADRPVADRSSLQDR